MRNIILELIGSHKTNIDPKLIIFEGETNELHSDRIIRECAIVVKHGVEQFDFDLDEEELEELIEYLSKMQSHIREFNRIEKKSQ